MNFDKRYLNVIKIDRTFDCKDKTLAEVLTPGFFQQDNPNDCYRQFTEGCFMEVFVKEGLALLLITKTPAKEKHGPVKVKHIPRI